MWLVAPSERVVAPSEHQRAGERTSERANPCDVEAAECAVDAFIADAALGSASLTDEIAACADEHQRFVVMLRQLDSFLTVGKAVWLSGLSMNELNSRWGVVADQRTCHWSVELGRTEARYPVELTDDGPPPAGCYYDMLQRRVVTVLSVRPINLRPGRPDQAHALGSGPSLEAIGLAFLKLSEDEVRNVFKQAWNLLEPHTAVNFSSVSKGLWASTEVLRQQLRAAHEATAALCLKGLTRCKVSPGFAIDKRDELNDNGSTTRQGQGLSAAELATLGTLLSLLPALKSLHLLEGAPLEGVRDTLHLQWRHAAPPSNDGMQQLAEGLVAGALPSVDRIVLMNTHVGDAGALALAAALGRGALRRLKYLKLENAAISDAGLIALTPALRRLPALVTLALPINPLGDEGFAALLAPPPLADATSPPTGGLTQLWHLDLSSTQVSDAGCAALVAAVNYGALPALGLPELFGIPASFAAKAAVSSRFIWRAGSYIQLREP